MLVKCELLYHHLTLYVNRIEFLTDKQMDDSNTTQILRSQGDKLKFAIDKLTNRPNLYVRENHISSV